MIEMCTDGYTLAWELIHFAIVTRAFGGRFEGHISRSADTAQQNIHVFGFHDVTALAD